MSVYHEAEQINLWFTLKIYVKTHFVLKMILLLHTNNCDKNSSINISTILSAVIEPVVTDAIEGYI